MLDNPKFLTACSTNWASRPDDERFLDLPSMLATFERSRDRSHVAGHALKRIEIDAEGDAAHKGLLVSTPERQGMALTNWSFGQLASLTGTPAGYMRTLPSELAADCMNYGLRFRRPHDDTQVMMTETEEGSVELRAATGINYGRVWNADVVRELMRRFGDGRTGDFRIPGEFGQEVEIGKHNTTLYGSDRDMFVFLADEKNRIEVPNRRNGGPGQMARGFFVWNSEVGSKSIGVAFFLFDFVCMNRIVWGVEEYSEKRLRHTVSAPDRWADEVTPVIHEFARSSARPIEATIRAAQQKRVDDLDEFLMKRSFTKKQVQRFAEAHEAEEGRPMRTIWDATTAITAVAREMPHNDSRIDLERAGGKLLDLVAA